MHTSLVSRQTHWSLVSLTKSVWRYFIISKSPNFDPPCQKNSLKTYQTATAKSCGFILASNVPWNETRIIGHGVSIFFLVFSITFRRKLGQLCAVNHFCALSLSSSLSFSPYWMKIEDWMKELSFKDHHSILITWGPGRNF